MGTSTFAALFLTLVCTTACERRLPVAPAGPITVFAAASTADVLREAGKRFEAQHGRQVAFSFDSSSNLAKQIKLGAPADVFISADLKWMDDVAAAGAILADSRQDLLANELVMIAPVGKKFDVKPSRDFDFKARLPQVKRIAMGDPAHVPAGRYARQTLESLGWWNALQPLLIPSQDVRAALRLVEIGEADAGIVYSTDASQSTGVVVVAEFPAELHEPIRYPIVLCTVSHAAAEFARFLRSPAIVTVFEQAGFRVLPLPPDSTSSSGAAR